MCAASVLYFNHFLLLLRNTILDTTERNKRYPHLSSSQMADYIHLTGYVHFITIKCFFSHTQIQITATMLNVEPLFLMYFYSVNRSREMFIINVNLIGSLSSCEWSSEKGNGKGHIILCIMLAKLDFFGHKCLWIPCKLYRSAQQCLQFVCFFPPA